MGESPRMEPTDAAARPFATMPPAMGMFRSLQGFNYRTWAVGALVSNVGTRMQRTAQDWLVLTQLTHNNGTAVGVVMALQFGPQVLLLPWTGYAADRFDGRKFLFVTQAALGTLALGLGALTLTGLVQMWHVYVFAFLLGCVTAFDTPARQAFVSELVADHDLPNAVGLNSTSFNVARFIGPAIAGVLIIAVGTGWVFLLNAASFVAVLVSLSLLRVTELRRRHGAERARGSFTEGFRFVWNRPDLRTILIMVFFVNIVGQSFPIFISTMAVSVFHKGAGQFGLLTSIMAIGCMSGALLAARRTNPRIPVLVAAAALFGLGMAIAAVMPYYSLFGIALAVVGISTQTFDSTSNSVLQLSSEPVMRGRVLAISVAIAVGGSPIGAPLIGWVADTFGPRWAIGVGAAAGIAAAFIGLRHLAKHRQAHRMPMPISHKLALSTGLTYSVLEWDGGGDHTVLLLHGYLDNAWGWQPVVDAGFGRGLHLVAPDMRGHGDSDWIGAGGYYHFLDYLADVHDLVAELGRARLSLVGHSMGGRIAAYYVGAFPERVHRLALLEGLGPPAENEPVAERIAPWLAACHHARERSPRTYASIDEAAARMVERDPKLPLSLARFLAEKGTRRQADGRLRFKHDPLHVTPPPIGFTVELASGFWRRVRCPTLLIDGAESPQRMPPEDIERRAGSFAQARHLLLPGAGHMVLRHQPEAVAALLDDFLEPP